MSVVSGMGSMDQCLFHQVFTGRAFTSACDSVLFLSFLFFDSCLMVEDFATNGDDEIYYLIIISPFGYRYSYTRIALICVMGPNAATWPRRNTVFVLEAQ